MLQVVEAARLLGVETVVVGIRPDVAQAIVAVGINLSRLTTFSTLQDSFNLLLNRQR
jgi:rsbT co-antagonist protein RsbR